MRIMLLACLIAFPTIAQQPDVAAQREAMKKLQFLVGKWSGPATVIRGPGEPLKLTQTEDVQYKLEGLVLLVEGAGSNSDGKVVFRALATISYDEATSSYRFRAYNDGRFLDTELAVSSKGFSWGFTAGPAKITNTMRITENGEWAETTEAAFGSAPPRKSVDMLLKHLP